MQGKMPATIDNQRFRGLLLALPAKAIQLLYENSYHSFLHIAKNMTHDALAAEDIVQETFVHVWENHKKLGQSNDLLIEHYIVRVIKNKAITHYKKQKRFHENLIKYHNGRVYEGDLSIEAVTIQQEVYQKLRIVVDTFPRREKECLLMKIDQEMSLDQIATELKVSRKAVERSITSANKRLRKYWAAAEKIDV